MFEIRNNNEELIMSKSQNYLNEPNYEICPNKRPGKWSTQPPSGNAILFMPIVTKT